MEFDDSSNHFISHYYHVLIVYMGHVLNKISAYGELLQLVFLYDNISRPTIPRPRAVISNISVSDNYLITNVYFTFGVYGTRQ